MQEIPDEHNSNINALPMRIRCKEPTKIRSEISSYGHLTTAKTNEDNKGVISFNKNDMKTKLKEQRSFQ